MSKKSFAETLPSTNNINSYDSLPTTPYRLFVDELEDRIKSVNSMSYPDEVRLMLLRGALLSLLKINPDHIVGDSVDNEY